MRSIAMGVLSGLMAISCASSRGRPAIAREDLEQQISTSLPVGSTIDAVMAFLDRKGIEHSPYLDEDRSIRAIVPPKEDGTLMSEYLAIIFRFDDAQLLQEHSIKSVASRGRPAIATDELERQISTNLPVGSTIDAVMAFLDRKGIEHSPYLDKDRSIHAIVRPKEEALITESLSIIFRFDEAHLLQEHSIESVLTGP
jgi:hypothetical protein